MTRQRDEFRSFKNTSVLYKDNNSLQLHSWCKIDGIQANDSYQWTVMMFGFLRLSDAVLDMLVDINMYEMAR